MATCVGLSTGYRILTELYIESLLADEALADEVWALWDAGVITDELAAIAWAILADNHRVVWESECSDDS